MCSVTSKSMGASSPIMRSAILRWPVLDIGSHSVKPWIRPRIIVFISWSMDCSPFSFLSVLRV